VFHISMWGGLKLCMGRLIPSKPPRGDGTDFWQQVPASKYAEFKRPVCNSFLCIAQQYCCEFFLCNEVRKTKNIVKP